MSARRLLILALLIGSPISLAVAALINATSNDFVQAGSQPGDLSDLLFDSFTCFSCHGNFDPDQEPHERWSGSMMANATRDPIFHAALAIANQDVAESGTYCIRCHSPTGFMEGDGTPADGSALAGDDYDGVNCHLCHRMVDPIADPANPAEDAAILAALTDVPTDPHSGQYVLDPFDRRRGPFTLNEPFFWHGWLESPFHQESLMCATCHEVSNPAISRVGGATPAASDTYVLNNLDEEHPTHEKTDQFPIERTYTEWLNSDFAAGPIDMGGRFGGNKQSVSTCQDCHMPDTTGVACAPGLNGTLRSDLPLHDFAGANSWVPEAIYRLDQSNALYGSGEESGVSLSVFRDAIARNISMLQRSCDLELKRQGKKLRVRIINQTGHKLPTGYGEGRRMWINAQFFNKQGVMIQELGAYDNSTAVLTTGDTKVYEIKHGLDATMATATGVPAGESFHFVLNNTIEKDNRIPPRGFTNAAFEAGQAQVVGATYVDGQYWDDTKFDIPANAWTARVTVFHQTTSKEYIDFLKAENTTNTAGDIAYDEWVAGGKSEPVAMQIKDCSLWPNKDVNLMGTVGDIGGTAPAVSVSGGGKQVLLVDLGEQYAGMEYFTVGTASGPAPARATSDLPVPIEFDAYTASTLRGNVPYLHESVGRIDENGRARIRFELPPNAPRSLAGRTLHHAVFVHRAGKILASSDPVAVELAP